MKKTEFIDCPECGAGVSMITNPSTCYKCKRPVYSAHPEIYEGGEQASPQADTVGALPDGEPRQPATPDMVAAPAHYTEYGFDGVELIEAIWRLPGPEFSAIQYIYRHRLKGGKEDLLKAIKYIQWIIEREYPGENA